MITMGLVMAAIFTVNAQSTTVDSLSILKAENQKLKNDLASATATGEANKSGCCHLHIDVETRTIKGVESCNGFYTGIGGGYDMLKYETEGVEGTTGAPVVTAKLGYRYYWFRPEVSVTGGFSETIDGRDYKMADFKAVVNVDILRFWRVEEKHFPIDPYVFGGISYNIIKSQKDTPVANLPYDGHNFRGVVGGGFMVKLGTFTNGHSTVVVGDKKYSLKRKSEIFLDINLPFAYGTLAKPRLAENEQPVMKIWTFTPNASLVVKF